MARQQRSDPGVTLITLIAWLIGWVGDHGWSAVMRVVVLIFALAAAGAILLAAIYLVRGG